MTKNDVDLVFKEKRLFSTNHFIVRWRRNGLAFPRQTFAFSRASGTAVLRNRFKRRLRALIQKQPLSVDFVFVAKGPLARISTPLWQSESKKIIEFCEKNFKPVSTTSD